MTTMHLLKQGAMQDKISTTFDTCIAYTAEPDGIYCFYFVPKRMSIQRTKQNIELCLRQPNLYLVGLMKTAAVFLALFKIEVITSFS